MGATRQCFRTTLAIFLCYSQDDTLEMRARPAKGLSKSGPEHHARESIMQVAIQLSNWQLAVLVVLPSLVSVSAWLNNNSRIGDLSGQLLQFRNEVNQRFLQVDQHFRDVNQRLDVLTGVVNDIDKRVTKVEAHLHME